MKKVKEFLKKGSVRILLGTLLILILVIALLGTIAKWTIEKYDGQWLGREIRVDKIRINAFTGEINIYNLNLMEANKVDTFVHINHAYADIEITHLISSNYDIAKILLERPIVSIWQTDSEFNFTDTMKEFATSDTTQKSNEPSEPTKFRLENLQIDSGRFKYVDKTIDAKFDIDRIFAKSPLIAWDEPNHHYELACESKQGGQLTSAMDLNINTLVYDLKANLQSFNISILKPYLTEFAKVNSLEGKTSTCFFLTGNFNQPSKITVSGNYGLNDFSITNIENDTLSRVGVFLLGIDSISTISNVYDFGDMKLANSYLKFELYADGDNFTSLLKDTTSASPNSTVPIDSAYAQLDYTNPFKVLSFYINDIVQKYQQQDYSFDSIAFTNNHIVYNDFTLHEKFQLQLQNLSVKAKELNSKNQHLNFVVSSNVNESGILNANLKVDPHDLMDIELVYQMEKVRISSFSPYSTYYVAHPFWDGLVSYDNKTQILNHKINSKNILRVNKIEVGKKIKNKTAYNLPIRLAVAILKDPKGNIELEIPVEGDLNDPKYKLGKVIWGIIKNLFLKIAASPFKLLSKAVGGNEDDLKYIKFEYLSDSLSKKQQKNLSLLANVIKQKPELKVELFYTAASPDELETLAAFEAKKRYLLKIDTIDEKDPTALQIKEIESLSINDSLFVNYLNKRLLFAGSASVIEKCKRYVGKGRLNSRMQAIIARRKKLIIDYLTSQQLKPISFSIADATEKSDGIPLFEVKFNVVEE
jgi:Domain of Unknown Function (DUF748)